MSWLCRFDIHRWEKWVNGPWMRFLDSGEPYFWSHRTCQCCGKQVRKINYPKWGN